MYGQYNGNRSYTSVATESVYGYARGQYSTALLGTGVQTHMAQAHIHVQTDAQHNSTYRKCPALATATGKQVQKIGQAKAEFYEHYRSPVDPQPIFGCMTDPCLVVLLVMLPQNRFLKISWALETASVLKLVGRWLHSARQAQRRFLHEFSFQSHDYESDVL